MESMAGIVWNMHPGNRFCLVDENIYFSEIGDDVFRTITFSGYDLPPYPPYGN
jgi:hypothetical protein